MKGRDPMDKGGRSGEVVREVASTLQSQQIES